MSSYPGKISRGRLLSRDRPRVNVAPTAVHRQAPAERVTVRPPVGWRGVAALGTGLALGLAVGAGTALLFAPRSGRETRRFIARAGRDMTRRTHDAWDDLGDELREAARRGRWAVTRTMKERRRAAERRRDRLARRLELALSDD